jgi:hypothetical protein
MLRRIALIFIVAEFFVCLPAVVYSKDSDLQDGKIVYQAVVVHMLAEKSFDREQCADELEEVNKRLDLAILDKYNEECKEMAYNECYWAWPEWNDGNYYAVKNCTSEELEQVNRAVIKIVLKEPIVFIKSRISAFNAIAAVQSNYNLYMPLILSIIVFIYAIVKRDNVLMLIFGGILCHVGLTVLSMPASYFKYFYEMYLCGYVFSGILVIDCLKNSGVEGNLTT